MPIYEYQCRVCGHSLEALQKISEDALTDCPECHKSTLQKLVSSSSFQLKGTGWYETDFKTKPQVDSKKPATTSVVETKTETPSASTTTTKTDTTGT